MSDLNQRPQTEKDEDKQNLFVAKVKEFVRGIEINKVKIRVANLFGKISFSKVNTKVKDIVSKIDINKASTKVKNIISRVDTSKIKQITARIKWRYVAAGCLVGAVTIGGSVYYYYYKNTGYEVFYNGKSIGFVRDKEVAAEAFKDAVEHIQLYDSAIKVDENLEFEKLLVDSDNLVSEEAIENTIEQDLLAKNEAYQIMVDGEKVAIVRSQEEADKIIEEVEKYYESQESKEDVKVLEVNIKDEITVEKTIADESSFTDTESVVQLLTSSKGTTKQYEVKSGDSIWRIARDNDMKISEITAINPDVDIDHLQIGQVINLAVSEPYLNVETVLETTVEEKIAYTTKYISDSNIYRGQTKVVSNGEYGVKEVVKKVTKLNGREVESTVLSSSVVKEPVARVVAKGTKPLVGSGSFRWPVSGSITSGYGSRWGSFHRGLDIAAPYGTPIRAADSGTVTYAGWRNSYGYLVIISHGNGYETYYGHCSSILVKQGQSVSKGDTIAKVGTTGNATGPHVHFEVRKNGSYQNPLLYLR